MRSIRSFEGCAISATDGTIGKVKNFYFDDEAWVIRYLVVDTSSWLGGREVLVSPYSLGEPAWAESLLAANISKNQVKESPGVDLVDKNGGDYNGYMGYLKNPSGNDGDPHLRSCNAVKGYHMRATDGHIGHVDGFLVDDFTWSIRYLVVNTGNWWTGHRVLLSPEWIQQVRWARGFALRSHAITRSHLAHSRRAGARTRAP